MKSIFTGTLAVFVLGAAIASSQTPPAPQAPSGAQPAGGQTEPSGQGQTAGQRSATTRSQTTTYKGILKGSATTGWTISPIDSRSGATGTAGATATAGAGSTTTYAVVAAEGSKVNLSSMADQCVEIVGVLAPESGAAAGGAAAGGAAGATSSSMSASAHRRLTVTTIKEVEGGCKQ